MNSLSHSTPSRRSQRFRTFLAWGLLIASFASPRTAFTEPSSQTQTPTPTTAQTELGSLVSMAGLSCRADTGAVRPVEKPDIEGDFRVSGTIKSGRSLTFDGQLHKITATTTSGANAAFSKQIRIGFEEAGNSSPFSDIKVGIGTLTPTQTLDVDGRARIRALPPGTTADRIVVATPSTGDLRAIPVSALSTANAWLLAGNTTSPADYIGTNNSMPFIIRTNAIEQMRVTNSGWVGIGTPNPSGHFELHNATNPIIAISSNTALGRFGVATCAGCFSGAAGLDDFVLGNGSLNVRDLLLTSRSDNPAGGAIRFATGTISGTFPADTEKMRITKAGDLGVGTASPTARTEILHSDLTANTVALRVSNTNPTGSAFTESAIGFNVALVSNPNFFASRIYSKYDGSWVGDGRLTLQVKNGTGALKDVLNIKNDRVGVNTIAPQDPLHVVGTVRLGLAGPATNHLCYNGTATSAVIASCAPSDERLKTNVLPLGNVLEKLEHVRGVSFEWNDQYRSLGGSSARREIGVMAQEVEGVFPELVSQDGDGYKRVDYERLAAVLIEAVKDLRKENDALKARTEALERAITKP